MEIKWTILGYLIYAGMGAYAAAFRAFLWGRPREGEAIMSVGFAVSAVAFGVRWVEVGHVPMQNLFEVFLTLGMLLYPMALFWGKVLGARGRAADALIGFILLFPAGLVFHAEPQKLPPALQSWLFIPHVTAYLLAYVILFRAAVQAGMQLGNREAGLAYERATYRLVKLGFPLLTLGLLLGALWGKIAWGDYWNWDPKELWSFVTFLVYVGYLHFRYTFGTRFPRANAALAVVGGAVVIITLLWVNLAPKIFPGMHVYGS